MKPKYIVGIIIAALVVVGAVIALEKKKIDYMDFTTAQQSGRRAQVAGTWVKDKGSQYVPTTNQFLFTMRDQTGHELPVILDGSKPNNFEISTMVVATGSVDHGEFHATGILTKCPSKYESSGPKPYETGS